MLPRMTILDSHPAAIGGVFLTTTGGEAGDGPEVKLHGLHGLGAAALSYHIHPLLHSVYSVLSVVRMEGADFTQPHAARDNARFFVGGWPEQRRKALGFFASFVPLCGKNGRGISPLAITVSAHGSGTTRSVSLASELD